ncbi:biosynthetic arginine decarboxylase [Photobacterium ganghwense]|uniref:Biosynthetic arginine decarboxylase n=1 Tax=Photobacterium ganghwense TaxID=320778 RepID=A0A0J1HGP7_9GAMM|nr:biosynthetic arginine decarboxylase [Photobacterium ganghwense]KLV10775.1 arginine decarboxylase [Photobacterium ganghwense]MBV1842796.1 biosynthetic arginine decarboxylase [Photobacterium ganghwense]PSU11053.1 biosynthetic arginine decarboxylase [Photobacterium ganghwense]QSV13158.1 biosynthetic arginine decarboxylase [Photobacterium ganghwense]
MSDWSIDNARDIYNTPYWGQGYFDINAEGDVTVSPDVSNPNNRIALSALADDLIAQGASLPVLVRFPEILHHRVDSLCATFNNAIADYGYDGQYLAVYPIKVNQQEAVVSEILASQYAKQQRQLGLEAGSKPELMAVLAMAHQASSVIVCNGYKDREYIRLALIGEKLGHEVYIVLEKLSELETVIQQAAELGVRPRLGLRARLTAQSKGKWEASGGEKSKFGLSASQVLTVMNKLRESNMLDCLQLLHFHLGSQIANIRDVRNGVSEAGRVYAELYRLGAGITTVDVGGGLAVDYEGTRSQNSCSMNYSLREYANNVVYTIGDICKEYGIAMPRIISESGRNLTAHHAVLISDVIGVESYKPEAAIAPPESAPQLLLNMWRSWLELSTLTDHRSLIEIYHDNQNDLAEAHTQFSMGMLTFEERAWAEQISLRLSFELQKRLSPKNRAHRPLLDELQERFADKFFVNFSLFQSLPDAWGIEQIFPVLPLSHLDKEPEQRAVIMDITCDSDGAIDQYVEGQGIESTLAVPSWSDETPYRMGFFLVGAYQEILGDMHNLFGDTDTAVVRCQPEGGYHIEHIDRGDSVGDVLRYVHLDAATFLRQYEEMVAKYLPPSEHSGILAELAEGLQGYTYLEDIRGCR